MLQLLARASLFSREDLQRDSSPRRWGPRRGTPAAAGGFPVISKKYVAVSFFYRVVDVAILELLNIFYFES
jgi:hypothetical protein